MDARNRVLDLNLAIAKNSPRYPQMSRFGNVIMIALETGEL